MGWLLPSGNQMLWIRPQLESIEQKRLAIKAQIKAHQISIIEGAIEQTHWGDENGAVDPKSWFSVAYDPDQAYWVARSNVEICQGFMKAKTGAAKKVGADLYLFSNAISGGPAAALLNYKWDSELVAKYSGNAYREIVKDSQGNVKNWVWRTRFVRQLDASAMTPAERLAEMIEAATRDKSFNEEMKKQFGMLGDPVFWVTMAGVFAVFIGVAGGAAVLGGAAFAAALSRLAGMSLLAMQVKPYVDLFKELQRCVFSDKQDDFVKGTKTLQVILCTAVRDIALLVTFEGAGKLGAKAANWLKTLFLRHAPMKWVEAAQTGKAEAEAMLARMKVRKYGYVGEQLLKKVNESTYFRQGEGATYRARSVRNGEMIALREVSTSRMGLLDTLGGWARGKPEWAKLKSWHGKWGIAGFRKTSETAAIVAKQAKSAYPLGMLKGVSPEIDALLARLPKDKNGYVHVDAYDVPYDQDVILNFEKDPSKPIKPKSGFDWKASGAKHSLAKGFKLIEVEDYYLLVDPLGNPVIQDVDIASIYKTRATVHANVSRPPGSKMPQVKVEVQDAGTHSGSHNQRAGKPGNPEDDFVIEEMENYRLFESNGEIYDPNKHGGSSGSTGHGEHNLSTGKKGWTPLHDDGTFDKEKILVFLPIRSLAGDVTHSCLRSELFEFDGWKSYLEFCEMNGIRMPWSSKGKNNTALPLGH